MKSWRFSGMAILALLVGVVFHHEMPSLPLRSAPQGQLAAAPPMGWNSWDCYGPAVTEAEVKANADYMAKVLAKHGWEYVVVDIQWSEPRAQAHGYRPDAELTMDGYGRLIPAPNRFPSSAGGKGFKPLADYIHSLGLKFGIHIMRGIPRQAARENTAVLGSNVCARDIANEKSICRWLTDMYGVDMTKPGAQAYYDSIAKLYAQWGVDYIKADDMTSPYHGDEIAALSRAIQKSRRPIVLSLSPGPAPLEEALELQRYAQLWRISGDFWDNWESLKRQFGRCRAWAPYVEPGHWPDADMLPLGHIGIRAEVGNDRKTRFTQDEQYTVMTLWSIFRSPLMFGGDLPSNDDFTLSLISNDEVLAVNRRSTGNRELFSRGDQIAWVADVPSSHDKYLALFNAADGVPSRIDVEWTAMGLAPHCKVRDLWQRKDLGTFRDDFSATVKAHGARLFRVSPL
jgi:alpha-galactosidase